jgi:hypothetical protein
MPIFTNAPPYRIGIWLYGWNTDGFVIWAGCVVLTQYISDVVGYTTPNTLLKTVRLPCLLS